MKDNHSIKVKITPDILLQELEGEAVLLNVSDEHYFGLDDVGLRFWKMLQKHENSAEVIRQLQIEYDVAEAVLHKDLGQFIVELEKAGLLSIVES
jgi:hypothetical protein